MCRVSSTCRIISPPTSPPPEPPIRTDASKRPNLTKRNRPASCGVLPNCYSSIAKYESTPNNDLDLVHVKEKRSSLVVSPTSNEQFRASPPKYKSPPEFKETPQERKELAPKCLFREEKNGDNLQLPSHGHVPKSPLDEKETSRENLSATSGSLSSLSPPSSPSKLKSEQEKQEEESNEKSLLSRKFLTFFNKYPTSCHCQTQKHFFLHNQDSRHNT